MGLNALYHLLRRPAILAVYMLFAGIILLVLWASGTKLDSLSEPGRLILLTMALPSIAGFFVGQSVGEIQYTPLSWSLPRMRQRLVSSVCFTGAVVSVLTGWTYDWLGGSAPIVPILASCFFWYGLVFTIGTYEFIDARSFGIRKSTVLYITILVFSVLSINRIADLYTSQPALCALFALIVALLYLIPAILAVYMLFAGIILLVLWASGTKLDSLSEPGRLIPLTMALPSIAGFFVGQSVGELQHTPLSWSLPRMRQRLVSSVCFTGAVVSVLTGWIYDWLGGSAPIVPILASCFFWYGLVFTIGTYEFIDARSFGIRKSTVLYITILVFSVLSINRIADLYTSQPALCALFALIVALLYLIHGIGVNAAREKSLVSLPLFHRYTLGSYQTAWLAGRRDSRRRWKRAAPLRGIVHWIRAGEYENYGTVRIGWLGLAFLSSLSLLALVAILIRIFGQYQPHTVVVVGLGIMMLQQSLYVQKGWLYPLSRSQLARLLYWSSLLHNALYCGPLILGSFLLEGLTGIFTGLDLTRPVLLMFICTPVIQWVRFRNEQFKVSSYVILALFLIGYTILSTTWLEFGPRISFAYEAAAVTGLILVSQGVFRHKIRRHFRSGDLV